MERRLGTASKHKGLSKSIRRHGFQHGKPECETNVLHADKQALRIAEQAQWRRGMIQGKQFGGLAMHHLNGTVCRAISRGS
jgi:hypothetical protein